MLVPLAPGFVNECQKGQLGERKGDHKRRASELLLRTPFDKQKGEGNGALIHRPRSSASSSHGGSIST